MNELLLRRRNAIVGSISWDSLAVQTIDSTQPNYNPAVAIVLNNNGFGKTTSEGRWYLTKNSALEISIGTMFKGVTTVTDTNGIVSDDTSVEYTFSSFNECKYLKGTNPTTGSNGSFYGCTMLESVELPEGITSVGQYVFYNCNQLNWLTFPSTLRSIGPYNFANSNLYTPNLHNVNFRGTLQQWVSINIQYGNWAPGISGIHFYLNNVEMTSLNLPANITSIPKGAFYGCMYILGDVIIPNTVTNIGERAFSNCSSLTNIITSNATIGVMAFGGSGNNTGILHIKGNPQGNNMGNISRFKKVIFRYGVSVPGSGMLLQQDGAVEILRIGTDFRATSNTYGICTGKPTDLKFIEIGNDIITNGYAIVGPSWYGSSDICCHFIKSTVPVTKASTNATRFSNFLNSLKTIYIGTGESQSADQNALDTYLQDSDWAAFQSKMELWHNYNGTYRTYTVTDTLTNVSNTNPIDYPYITRNESYTTILEPNEGYTLSSVQILMYEAIDDGTTPQTPTDITSSVYNSVTHEVTIPQVTGNITIIANAT